MLNPEKTRKFKILRSFQLAFMVVAPLLGLFYFSIGATFLFYVTFCAAFLTVPAFFLIKKSTGLTWTGNYSILIPWITLLIISWNTGAVTQEGVIRPSWIMNAGLVLFAVFLKGYLWGTVWTSLTFMEMGVMIYLFRTGFAFPNVIPMEISAVYSLGSYLVCLLAVISFAFLFEKERSEASIRERETAAAIRESKRYINDILERSPVPTFIMDRNHRIVQWNHACQDLTGISLGDILGKGVWEGFNMDGHGSIADIVIDNPAAVEEYFGDRIVSRSDDGWFELEMPLPKLSGGRRVVITVAPIMDHESNIRGAIQTIQTLDLNGTSEDLKAGVLGEMDEAFPSPVFRINRQGEIVFWNRACEEALGYDASEMIGKSPFTFISRRYRPHFKETVLKAFRGEASNHTSWKYYSKEKEPFYVLAGVRAVRSSSSRVKECMIVNTDITALRQRMKKLEIYASKTNERLKKLTTEYDLLKRNIATFIRKKEE